MIEFLIDSWAHIYPFAARHLHDEMAWNDLSLDDHLPHEPLYNVVPKMTTSKFWPGQNCAQKNDELGPAHPTAAAAMFVLIKTRAVTTGPFSFLQRYKIAEIMTISAICSDKQSRFWAIVFWRWQQIHRPPL